jgi:chromosome segregation ATPase
MAQEQSVQSTIYLLRQESDERYRKLSAELEDAQQANLTLVRRLEALEEENRSLRNSINKLPADLVTESDAKKLSDALVEQIKSVDGKRAEDNKIISEEIKKIWKAIEELGKAPAPKEVKRATDKPRRVPKRIAEVVLEKGYTLSAIAEAYRLEGYDVTVDGILEANPNITDPTKIRAGDTIIVPIEW